MPASSKAQQRFFGVVKAMQKGDLPKTGKAGKIAKTMSKKDVDDFASTKHKGKPEKVKREMKVRNLIKKMVREELENINEVDFSKIKLPSQVDRFLNKFVDSMKGANLNRMKRASILYKVIDAAGMTPQQLMADINKIKQAMKNEGTCGYGENGELGEEPAGPHLIKKIKEGKDTIFDVAKKVMKDKQHQNYKSKKGMVKLDMQTANLLTQVFKKINPKMKKILSDLGEKNPAQLVATLQAVVK